MIISNHTPGDHAKHPEIKFIFILIGKKYTPVFNIVSIF